MAKTVWKFTNQRELDKSEFINYFERKVFRTIRKFSLLPKNKIFIIKKSNDLNTKVLTEILKTKFEVKTSARPNISTDNLSQVAEDIFKKILKGNFNFQKILPKTSVAQVGRSPNLQAKRTPSEAYSNLPTTKAPLLYLSDSEIKLYAKLKNIKGNSRKQDKKIQSLFQKFLKNNQDLEQNILKSTLQLK